MQASALDDLLTALATDAAGRERLASFLAEQLQPRTVHTVATLARELEVTERTVRRAIEHGELAATRRAGRWVMTVEDVAAWIRSGAGRSAVTPRAPRSRVVGSSLSAVFAEQGHP